MMADSLRRSPDSQFPLRWLLVIPFVGLTVSAVGLTGWLTIRNGQSAVKDVAGQLGEKVALNISAPLQDYLATPHLLQQSYSQTLRQGLLDPQDFDQMLRFFWGQTRPLDPTIGTIAFANLEGEFVGANQPENYLALANRDTGGAIRRYATDAEGNPQEIIRESPNYDARTRSWYQTAIEVGEPTWTEIEPSVTGRRLDVSAVTPYFDQAGMLQGVLLADLSLGQISRFLAGLTIGKTGLAFITERNGLLVGTSTSELPFTIPAEGEDPLRLAATASENQVIQAAAQTLTDQFEDLSQIQSLTQLSFSLQKNRYFLLSLPGKS